MFTYDSKNDQFKKVPKNEDNGEQYLDSDFTGLIARPKRTGSKHSIRSGSDKVTNYVRIVTQKGRTNTHFTHIHKKGIQYFRDLGNTLLHIQWRWILILVFAVNMFTFLIFGLLWMAVGTIGGDFDNNNATQCVVNAKSFASYFLLSVETIMTVGYGTRYPTEQCTQGWLLQILQALIGVALQGVLISAVYVKVSKPYTHNVLSLFSKKAVIHLRDGKLCLMFRINDTTMKLIVGTKICLYYVDKTALQDEDYEKSAGIKMEEIKIEPFGLLIFPTEIVHVIDEYSPLWRISAYKLLKSRCEIVVVAEGTSVITGQYSQNKTSYTNNDILWGHKFEECMDFDEEKMKYVVNHKKINISRICQTPLCSGEKLERVANLCGM